MKLEQLLEGVPFTLAQGSLDTEISDIIYDSRKAAPGLLFVCIVGTQRDSHEFAADCAAKGVSALVIQHDIDLSAMPGVTVVKVESSRYAMAPDTSVEAPTPTSEPKAAARFIRGKVIANPEIAKGPTPCPIKILSTML